MIIKISSDLKKQEIWANGAELAGIMGVDRINGKRVTDFPLDKKKYVYTFNNPVLLTDNYRIGKLKPTLRDTIFSLYTMRPRTVEYDNVSVDWDHSHISVWCPSIDTVLLAKALGDILKNKNNKFKKAIELGCGSGFLSKYLLAKSKTIRSMTVNDINPYAIKCAKENINDKRAIFRIGDGLKEIKGKKYDLIICNPPYIPRKNSIDDNPYEGIGLLNYLIHEGQNYLNPRGILIINISSLCIKQVLKVKPKMKMTLLEKMTVPLKVNNILNSPSWISYLKQVGLKKAKNGYDYQQTLYIMKFQNN